MGFRFRKSVKILPGVRLNFTHRGMSATVGRRGASVTVGKRGTHMNVGIPGTGLSYRTRVGAAPGAPVSTEPAKPVHALIGGGIVLAVFGACAISFARFSEQQKIDEAARLARVARADSLREPLVDTLRGACAFDRSNGRFLGRVVLVYGQPLLNPRPENERLKLDVALRTRLHQQYGKTTEYFMYPRQVRVRRCSMGVND